MLTDTSTLGELVTAFPKAAKVLHAHGLDYCCGGSRTLEGACAEAGVNPSAVMAEVMAASEAPAATEVVHWEERPLDELIEHILERYHAPLKTELPRILGLARKVEAAHAGEPDAPQGLLRILAEAHAEVESHLAKEEQILFPLILSGRGPEAGMPVQIMVQEHEDHGRNLRYIRKATHDFTLPADACPTWRELYRSLQELEVDLMDHIHLENNILFPRALADR
jgi:regulator of cell morphogenesis and NO signaling